MKFTGITAELAVITDEIGFYEDLSEANKTLFVKQAARYLCTVKNGSHIAQFVDGLQTLKIVDLIKKHPGLLDVNWSFQRK